MPALPLQLSALEVPRLSAVLRTGVPAPSKSRDIQSRFGGSLVSLPSGPIAVQHEIFQIDAKFNCQYTSSDAVLQQSAPDESLLVFRLTRLGGDVNKTSRVHPADLLGFSRLAIDGTVRLTDVIEAMHDAITGAPGLFGTPARWTTGDISGLVYNSIRKVTGLVGGGLD